MMRSDERDKFIRRITANMKVIETRSDPSPLGIFGEKVM